MFTEENVLEALKMEREHYENDPERFASLTVIINKIENLEKKNSDLVKEVEVDLITMSSLDERLEVSDNKVASLKSLLKDICDEWNERCEDDCNSHGHTDTCCNVDISNAKRAMRLEIEDLKNKLAKVEKYANHTYACVNNDDGEGCSCGLRDIDFSDTSKKEDSPSREEALKFLQVVDQLCSYEGEQRTIRSYGGIFRNEELPIPEVVSVITWLTEKYNINKDDMTGWRNR
jgi:hypothetical protein